MLSSRAVRGKYITIAMCATIAFCFPVFTHAGFTSQNYRIDTYSIGSVGGTFSSPNYTVTGGIGNTYTLNDSDVQEGPPASEGNGNSSSRGRRGNSSNEPQATGILGPSDVLFRDNLGFALAEKGLPTDRAPQENGNTATRTHEIPSQSSEFAEVPASKLLASVISGDLSGVGAYMKHIYRTLFDTFTARLSLFLMVLAVFFYLRTFTRLGKRHSPF
jgi:hypothetical protein